MDDRNDAELSDLAGSVDDRLTQLARLEAERRALPAEWLRRQLHAALEAWAADESEIDIDSERRSDF